jgi:hypothetical protein
MDAGNENSSSRRTSSQVRNEPLVHDTHHRVGDSQSTDLNQQRSHDEASSNRTSTSSTRHPNRISMNNRQRGFWRNNNARLTIERGLSAHDRIQRWVNEVSVDESTVGNENPVPPVVQPARLLARNYRANIQDLAAYYALDNVIVKNTGIFKMPRIVCYDRIGLADQSHTVRSEPWHGRGTVPSPSEFLVRIIKVPAGCSQRVLLVEDLTPRMIDLLGSTFQIPPHMFESHLDRSGYAAASGDRNTTATWRNRPAAQGYTSITWYRPVLPSVYLTSKLHTDLIHNREPHILCPKENCGNHTVCLRRITNVWRDYFSLCPEPGSNQEEYLIDYPVGWQERATICTREIGKCTFGTVLRHLCICIFSDVCSHCVT